MEFIGPKMQSSCGIFVLLPVKIVKLLTQHVVKGKFWVPTNGSPPCIGSGVTSLQYQITASHTKEVINYVIKQKQNETIYVRKIILNVF